MVTVLIPTFNRPHLLRTALASVSSQTGIQYISKVIVSENGLNSNSKDICNEFLNIPIEYVYQTEQLPVLEHLRWLMSKEKVGYTALLCDDDWWNEYHIELAVRNLMANSTVVAYFSNFVWVDSESRLNFNAYTGTRFFDIENRHTNNARVINYSREDLLLTSFILTPFHYSALVCKAEVLAKAVEVFDDIHPTYSDRILWPAIAEYGTVLFNPLATAIIRNHAQQDSFNYSSADWKIQNHQGSIRIKEIAEKAGVDVQGKINKFYLNSPSDIQQAMDVEFNRIFPDKRLMNWYAGIGEILLREKSKKSRVKVIARGLLDIFRKLST